VHLDFGHLAGTIKQVSPQQLELLGAKNQESRQKAVQIIQSVVGRFQKQKALQAIPRSTKSHVFAVDDDEKKDSNVLTKR